MIYNIFCSIHKNELEARYGREIDYALDYLYRTELAEIEADSLTEANEKYSCIFGDKIDELLHFNHMVYFFNDNN